MNLPQATLPQHLQKYIVSQNYEKYTDLDHAVWRYVLRQLKNFLSANAHESYLEGLKKTGIEIERIPRIENISRELEKFGWCALPVSGFIPPAAFMELQSLRVLPIASDMRSIDHLTYTPAPDIVHEAAGHAPIIANAEYAAYLKQYAQVAKKALISRQDLKVYKAIRELSDIKENPASTPAEIESAETTLVNVSNSVTIVSEAAELSRMNWWTAEYGLIGPLQAPKIFGAGLLSSVGESKWCLSEKVKKIPLSLACIHQSYDITEPQPQLFVARDFQHLSEVLEELAATMAYRTGGMAALQKAIDAESINTVEFENQLQISGVLKSVLTDSEGLPCYLQFNGPTQLSQNEKQLEAHSTSYHTEGYGTPVGAIHDFSLSSLQIHKPLILNYKSGVRVEGLLKKIEGAVLTLTGAVCTLGKETLFKPEWGNYDIVLANEVTSVWGGPADREAFGEIDDFVASRVQAPTYSQKQQEIFSFYRDTASLRAGADNINALFEKFREKAPDQWLLFIELLEVAVKNNLATKEIEAHLKTLPQKSLIDDGMKLAYAKY